MTASRVRVGNMLSSMCIHVEPFVVFSLPFCVSFGPSVFAFGNMLSSLVKSSLSSDFASLAGWCRGTVHSKWRRRCASKETVRDLPYPGEGGLRKEKRSRRRHLPACSCLRQIPIRIASKTEKQQATRNKYIASSNKCLTSSNKISFLLLLVRHLLLEAMHLLLAGIDGISIESTPRAETRL